MPRRPLRSCLLPPPPFIQPRAPERPLAPPSQGPSPVHACAQGTALPAALPGARRCCGEHIAAAAPPPHGLRPRARGLAGAAPQRLPPPSARLASFYFIPCLTRFTAPRCQPPASPWPDPHQSMSDQPPAPRPALSFRQHRHQTYPSCHSNPPNSTIEAQTGHGGSRGVETARGGVQIMGSMERAQSLGAAGQSVGQQWQPTRRGQHHTSCCSAAGGAASLPAPQPLHQLGRCGPGSGVDLCAGVEEAARQGRRVGRHRHAASARLAFPLSLDGRLCEQREVGHRNVGTSCEGTCSHVAQRGVQACQQRARQRSDLCNP